MKHSVLQKPLITVHIHIIA